MGKLRFTTETGSRYELDREAMTWKRLRVTGRSGKIRAEDGKLREWPGVRCGMRAYLDDMKVKKGYDRHIVETSRVATVTKED